MNSDSRAHKCLIKDLFVGVSPAAGSGVSVTNWNCEGFDPCCCFTLSPYSTKRPSGMGGILSRLGGKKPKMSTLEKSKMDWDAFKSEEGITEELAIHNRGKEG